MARRELFLTLEKLTAAKIYTIYSISVVYTYKQFTISSKQFTQMRPRLFRLQSLKSFPPSPTKAPQG